MAQRFPSNIVPGPATTGMGELSYVERQDAVPAYRWGETPEGLGSRHPVPYYFRTTPMEGLGSLGVTTLPGDALIVQGSPSQDYAQALETIAPNVTTLVSENRAPTESFWDALTRLMPAIAATEQQRALLKAQADRARAGLPPMDVTQYGLGAQTGLSVNAQEALMLGGLALAVVLGFTLLRRRS